MSDALLRTEKLRKDFKSLTAVDEVDAEFDKERLHAIIGPNGAGKTTFFNLLTGTLQPTSGRILFKGEEITDAAPEEIARRGLTRSYQVTNVFDGLSVLENVRVAVQARHTAYNFWNDADTMTDFIDEAERILERVDLLHKRDSLAETLSHGEQRTLELAVALGTDPEMLLLDEPSSGMSAEETKEIITLIDELSRDKAVILVEHKMSVVMNVADRILVLHNGRVIADGSPEEIRNDKQVQDVYLGGGGES